ncbi:MAG: cytochrome P450 [Pseudonocardiaceae bacterium]
MNRTDNDRGRPAPVVALALHHREGDLLVDLVKLPEHGPVVRIPHGDGHAWVVSDPELVSSVLKDMRFSKEGRHAPPWFVDESGLIGSPETSRASDIVTSEGAEHKRLRKLHMLALSPARIQGWSATISSVTDELLDTMERQAGAAARTTPVDLVSGLAYPLPLTIICTLLGLPRDVHPAMRNASEKIFFGGSAAVRDAGRGQLYSTVAELIDHYPDRLSDGMITDLIALTRSDPPQASRTEVKAWIPSLILPGHESTAGLLSSALYELLLARHRGVIITTESVDTVVEEILRLHPPFPLATWRFATCDIALSNIDIPSGAPVLVNLAAANRDPRSCPRPDQFIPDRDPINHVSFGVGVHYCVGAGLARLETRTAISAFLRRFPDARLANPGAPASWQSDLLSRRIVTLPVILGSARSGGGPA